MRTFPEGFPKENYLVKKHISFSCATSKIHFYMLGVPLSVFITSQLFICLSLPLSEGAGFSAVVEFIRRNTWGLAAEIDCRKALRLTSAWAMLNVGLYTFLSIISAFVMLNMEKLKGNTSWLDSKLLTAWRSVREGPAYSCSWIKDLYFQKYFISRSSKSSVLGKLFPDIVTELKTVLLASLMYKLIKTYIDRHTGGVSSTLTLKIRFLKIVSMVLWGIYPHVRALEYNIDNFVEAIGHEVVGVVNYHEKNKWNFLGLLLRDRANPPE